MVTPSKIINDEFFAERSVLNASTGCVEWLRHKNVGGYGTVKHKRKYWLAHRLLWTHKFGPIPEGKIICHKCDNRRCINPDHLFIGVTQDNVDDKIAKGRLRVARGAEAGNAKLTDEQIQAIRLDVRSQYQIARHYGISQSNVSIIKSGVSWAHVEMPPEDKRLNIKQFADLLGVPYSSLKNRLCNGYLSAHQAVMRTTKQFGVEAWA